MAKTETDLPEIAGQSVERTSQLINDGEFGNSRFVEENELTEIITDVILDELQPQEHYFSNLTTVNVVHGLGKYPRVTVLIGAEEVESDITHTPDKNSLTVSFSRPYSGIVIVQ